jgi:hypothetical protein
MNYSEEGIKILQYNVMKSRDVVMAILLGNPRIQEYDFLVLQEPWRNSFISTTNNPIAHSFHICLPNDSREAPARVCFFVNKRIDPNRWRFTEHTRDLSIVEITTTNPTTETAKRSIYTTYITPEIVRPSDELPDNTSERHFPLTRKKNKSFWVILTYTMNSGAA